MSQSFEWLPVIASQLSVFCHLIRKYFAQLDDQQSLEFLQQSASQKANYSFSTSQRINSGTVDILKTTT